MRDCCCRHRSLSVSGSRGLVNDSVWLDLRVPGAALAGRKVMSLVSGMLAGVDSIDDMDVLRAGSTGLILGHRVMVPSTLGTFLRAFCKRRDKPVRRRR
jgi:hypothetical protein